LRGPPAADPQSALPEHSLFQHGRAQHRWHKDRPDFHKKLFLKIGPGEDYEKVRKQTARERGRIRARDVAVKGIFIRPPGSLKP
jgi:hypothetical protein